MTAAQQAGSMRMARSRAKTASKVIPSSLKGSEISHARGQSSSASSATGQHRISNRNQATNTNSGLIERTLRRTRPDYVTECGSGQDVAVRRHASEVRVVLAGVLLAWASAG
jgi:hypothetical protein